MILIMVIGDESGCLPFFTNSETIPAVTIILRNLIVTNCQLGWSNVDTFPIYGIPHTHMPLPKDTESGRPPALHFLNLGTQGAP